MMLTTGLRRGLNIGRTCGTKIIGQENSLNVYQASRMSTSFFRPDGVPELLGMTKKRFTRTVKQYGEITPPSSSHDPEIFAIQRRVFGIAPKEDFKTGRKVLNAPNRGPAITSWYPVTEGHMRAGVANALRESIRNAETQLEKSELTKLLEDVKYSPDVLRRRKKLVMLKRRGKAPPKKGQGKRASGGKKKK